MLFYNKYDIILILKYQLENIGNYYENNVIKFKRKCI